MRLEDLVKPLDQMTDAELIEHLRAIKQRRTVERPAAAKRVERVERKESRSAGKKVSALLDGMSEEDRQRLIEQLQQGELDV